MKVAFIGLGNMGGPMAENLVGKGNKVTVYDVVRSAVDGLVAKGAQGAHSAVEAVTGADVVISMLPAAQHVKSLYLGATGILSSLSANALVIDCSTIDADTAKEVGAAVIDTGRAFIDAPVSGGVAGAKAGTLTFIAGGEEAAFSRAQPILACMGASLFHAGDLGAGQIAKICNNMLLSVLMAGTSEALQLAIANGLDPKTVSDIMLQSSGANWALQKYNPCPGVMENVPASNEYEGGFQVRLMNKDLNLAMDNAQSNGVSTPMASTAQSLYRIHQRQGNELKDFSSIFTLFDKRD